VVRVSSLLRHHAETLAKSAIDGTVARERGYFSVERKQELEQLGFGRTQQLVPTMAIPVRGVVAGERRGTSTVPTGRASKTAANASTRSPPAARSALTCTRA
jgi:hypothetical protein